MKIAFIHPFLFRYARGIERFTFNLANLLAQSGVEVHLLTWHWQSAVQIEGLDPTVRVHVFPVVRYYAAKVIVPFYATHLLNHRYDFVWIFFAGYGESGALTLTPRQRFGIVFHYPYEQVPHRYAEFNRFGLAQRATRIVSVSRFVADGVRLAFNRESVVIHHGVDAERFKPNDAARAQMHSALCLSPDAPLVVTAAALEERKGVQWVLRALPAVVHQFPNAIYLVLGDGPHRRSLQRLACDLGVEKNVRFLGAQSDVIPFYQASDISLILSRGEASSLSALESLACGVPVIAACRPPFDELIQPDYGLMLDETNTQQVSGALIALLSDSGRRQAMGATGRAHVSANFTWARVAEQYLQLVNSAIDN